MGKWLKEPLLHFAVLGAALFMAYSALNPAETTGTEIVVSAGQGSQRYLERARAWPGMAP